MPTLIPLKGRRRQENDRQSSVRLRKSLQFHSVEGKAQAIIVNRTIEGFCKKSLGLDIWLPVTSHRRLLWVSLCVLLLHSFPALAQSQQSPVVQAGERDLPDTTETKAASEQALSQRLAGTISGTVVDQMSVFVPGVRVQLSRKDQSESPDVLSDGDGQFSFAGIAPGPFLLTATSDGFAARTFSGILHSGENYTVPPIALAVTTVVTEVKVSLSRTEVAEAELKDEEKQRILGVVPNFYVTYNHAAAPLNPRQKFELAWKATMDPINLGLTGLTAGIQQATNSLSGYGQGAAGYGKRYAANYANSITGTFIGSAILPSLFKQDPRYFYRGTGTWRSRLLYAIASSVICKGDNGHWQANYSGLLGNLAAGGISNLYYPAANRNGAALTFENALSTTGSTAIANVVQEFLVRKMTPHAPNYSSAKTDER